jgi:hypothetical protein
MILLPSAERPHQQPPGVPQGQHRQVHSGVSNRTVAKTAWRSSPRQGSTARSIVRRLTRIPFSSSSSSSCLTTSALPRWAKNLCRNHSRWPSDVGPNPLSRAVAWPPHPQASALPSPEPSAPEMALLHTPCRLGCHAPRGGPVFISPPDQFSLSPDRPSNSAAAD